MTFKHSTVLGITASLPVNTALADVKIDFIGSLGLDTGPVTLRGAEIAVEKTNAAGGMSGKKLVSVSAGTSGGATEGVKACEYLVEAGEVNFTTSGSIDDVSLGWLPHMQEFQIPTLGTWTPYVGIIDMITENPETIAPCFMNIALDEALATLYISFGADVLKEEVSRDSVIVLAEDTAFSGAIAGFATEALGPVAGIETKKIIVYDVDMVDFAPLFSKVQAPGADSVYQVSSVNSQMVSSQYVKLQVPMVITGMNVSTLGLECWEDTGDVGGGIPALSLIPSVGFELDPEGQKFADTYQAKYDSRPKMPHFNGFNAYWGPEQTVAVAETAGGFDDAKAQSAGMKKQDITLKKDDKMWSRYTFWSNDKIEEVADRIYPHNARFDLTVPYDNTQPPIVIIRWKRDGEVGVAYPPEYATTKFTMPS